MSALRIPLNMVQIEAAGRLHGRLTSWAITDAALERLRTQFPDFDPVSVLIKAAAVNQLYYTGVRRLPRLAQHVASVMA